MSRPNIFIYNCDTKTEEVREMTEEEYAQHLLDQVMVESMGGESNGN